MNQNYVFNQFIQQRLRLIRRNRFWHTFAALLIILSLLSNIGYTMTVAHAAPLAYQTSGEISGNVFNDYNANGSDDGAGEGGIAGIVVTAYDASGGSFTDTTNANGSYTITGLTDSTEYRVEFTRPTSLTSFEPGAAGNSTVQFVAAPANNVNVGFNYPAHYCQNNPTLATSCYVQGPQNGITDDVMVSFPYNAGCADSNLDGTCDSGSFNNPTPAHVATAGEMGTTWGLAYQRTTNTLFSGAFMKRHTGFRQNGETGSIYKIEDPDTVTPTITEYVDLDALGFDTGSDPHPADNATGLAWEEDNSSWDPVGKMSLGDIDISDDEQTLWTVNLFDRKLYSVPIQAAAVQASDIDSYDITNPCGNTTDFRPFAVAFHEGLVYVGVTCTGESTVPGSHTASQVTNHVGNRNQLSAYIYSFDPQSPGFTEELTTPLNYARDRSINSGTLPSDGEWNPWVPVFTAYNRNNAGCAYDRAYPQPWLTDIEFDNGNMILGIRDRFGDQTGYDQRPVSGVNVNGAGTGCSPQGYFNGTGVGDTLRACGNPANGWTLESNGSCGGITTSGSANSEGPGNGEYYYQDDYHYTLGSFTKFHNDVGLGGLVQVPGAAEVATTAMDPINHPDEFYNSGILWFNNSNGTRPRSYEVFDTAPNFGQPGDGTLAKANGLGDLEALCFAAPIEVGNRVWNDTDGDGIQDAGEAGINNVVVTLHAPNGTQVASATTDGQGRYYFSSGSGTNTPSKIYGINGLTASTTGFEIRVDTTQVPVASLSLSPQDNDANDDPDDGDLRDSDADLSGNSAIVAFDTGSAGANNHAYDYGFTAQVAEQVAIGNFVWDDLDNDGVFDSADGEAGIDGVEVQLFQGTTVSGPAFMTTTTASGGFYLFDNLAEGEYVLHVPASEFAASGSLEGYLSSAPEGGDSAVDDNVDENGQNTLDSGGISSTAINLQAGDEPTGEAGQGNYSGSLDDGNVNMTVDFGFYRLSLGNLVFNDVYNNGTFDPSENDAGIDGVVVNLYQGATVSGAPFMTTTTSGGGFYLFDGLTESDYVVELAASNWDAGGILERYLSSLTNPVTLTDTAPDPDNDVNDDDNGAQQSSPLSVVSQPVTLAATGEPTNDGDSDASSNLSVDFGLFDPDIGDLVFCDANGNNVFDANSTDYGIGGVLLNLYVDNGNSDGELDAGDTLTRTTTTTTTGEYGFAFLPPDDYIVEVDQSNFAGGQVLDGATSVAGATDPDDDINNDDNGAPTTGFGIVALPLTLTSGGEPTNDGDGSAFTNLTVDFGFLQCNGAPEFEIAKWVNTPPTVTVGSPISFTIRITNTGNVTITSLPLTDTYETVYLTFDSVIDASGPNPASDATNDGSITWDNAIDYDADNQLVPNETLDLVVTFIAKAETTSLSGNIECEGTGFTYNIATAFGQEACVEVPIDPQPSKSTLGDFVWYDVNGNGVKDDGEVGIDDVRVELYEVVDAGGGLTTTQFITFQMTGPDRTGIDSDDTPTYGDAGAYDFVVQDNKTYQVVITDTNFLPSGALENYTYTGENSNANAYNGPNPRTVVIGTQEDYNDADFPFTVAIEPTIAVSKQLNGSNPFVVGVPVSFTIHVTNTGSVTITTLPLEDRYSSVFIEYLATGTNPTPDNAAEGVLTWANLLSGDADGLGSGESVTIDVFFTTLADTTLLPAMNPCSSSGHAPNLARSVGGMADATPVVEDADDTSCDSVQILNPTAVQLAERQISQTPDGVLVRWSTVNEDDLIGFNIWQANGVDDIRQRSSTIIEAKKAGQTAGASYTWLDENARLSHGDIYILEMIKNDGTTEHIVIDVMTGGPIYLPFVMN